MGINRVVQFQFKPDTGSDAIEKVSAKIQEMREKCLHPESKQPYIQSIQGGADSAPEGLQIADSNNSKVSLMHSSSNSTALKTGTTTPSKTQSTSLSWQSWALW
ncbi:hypothetical protein FOMG_18504 [Fusarium oxysporum f. sp. melonis 26406]|uniref:Stress-response A/B barrel domain-containing protein n=1 Tax=Fusarium oxysporum f. sp. melonis 26406 TaxID=1089452 RepID=W9Z065_FUSOX|nr:hypothetical protein FOMG_18504 [Fusarium oxysporum f. sp. melonis 26406]